ncbi:hypothetical protein B5V89_16650 [Heyndrickxia sporothermodurans]|uniref:hypothetical protein n=1 Tax=Heyndrickxia TaxID=2837504 RepID=UPI0008260810|nr:hypothetical protein [Heyndrickxia sporothermodurans]PTY76895.1 hypothetical protein B5V89_16650 [Heyndrickxia sporothermodurans]
MNPLQEERQVQPNKAFESFLSFVAFTIALKLLPLFECLTDNLALQIILGLALAALVIQWFINNNKLVDMLRIMCKRLNLNIVYLYLAYIILYLVVVLVIL